MEEGLNEGCYNSRMEGITAARRTKEDREIKEE